MALSPLVVRTLALETRALSSRLARVEPFARTIPRVAAADVPRSTATAIDRHLLAGRRELAGLVGEYLRWLLGPGRRSATAAEAQRRFAFLKLKLNAVLTQLDIFADALLQRAELGYGSWLAGLDALAADALALPAAPYERPPIITYLDRGHGAAIRRARTRLPGGGENPVAIVRVPRERMVGSGIASSLIHEVGHQGAALLGLVDSLRRELRAETARQRGSQRDAWGMWERWISEIIADFWAVALVGVTAAQGLMGVVSLPRAFVFRLALDDPHPFPWIRVKLAIAFGELLYPEPQWRVLDALWESLYPRRGLPAPSLRQIAALEATLPRFVETVAGHRPAALAGRSLRMVFPLNERQPWRLRKMFERWRARPATAFSVAPTLAFAILGQARQDGRLEPETESRLVARLLNHWALARALQTQPSAAVRAPERALALAA